MAKIALVRHAQSEWNKLGLWTGWTDIGLSSNGLKEAKKAADLLKDIDFDGFFSSDLIRAVNTLEIIKSALNKISLPIVKHKALKERNYGVFTGKNKWEIKEKLGEAKFMAIRRGWNEKIIDGETLKEVHDRAVPYFTTAILPQLKKGRNILVVAHGNTIRALIKHLEGISNEKISEVEIETGEIVIYELNQKGHIINMERRKNVE